MNHLRTVLTALTLFGMAVTMGVSYGLKPAKGLATLEIPHGATPTVDGTLASGEWTGALKLSINGLAPGENYGWNPLNGNVLQPADCSFDLYILHDGESLYVGLDVTDDSVSHDNAPSQTAHYNVWEDDCTEVFINGDFDDGNSEGAHNADPDDNDWNEGQIPHFGIWGQAYWDGNRNTKDVTWFASTGITTKGFMTEYRFPLATIDTVDGPGAAPLTVGKTFGFNALVNDDDNGGDREDQLSLAGGDFDNTLYHTQEDWVPAVLMPEVTGHTADADKDKVIALEELLQVIQFFNADGFHCQEGTEDDYLAGTGATEVCAQHDGDYSPQDWKISLSECLRLVQLYNANGYESCPDSNAEDGYCPVLG
jgi:hypothetical protein